MNSRSERPQFDVDLEFFDGFASLDGFELLDGFNSTASSDLNFDSFAGLCDLRSMVSRVLQVYATSLSMNLQVYATSLRWMTTI